MSYRRVLQSAESSGSKHEPRPAEQSNNKGKVVGREVTWGVCGKKTAAYSLLVLGIVTLSCGCLFGMRVIGEEVGVGDRVRTSVGGTLLLLSMIPIGAGLSLLQRTVMNERNAT